MTHFECDDWLCARLADHRSTRQRIRTSVGLIGTGSDSFLSRVVGAGHASSCKGCGAARGAPVYRIGCLGNAQAMGRPEVLAASRFESYDSDSV